MKNGLTKFCHTPIYRAVGQIITQQVVVELVNNPKTACEVYVNNNQILL